MQTSSSSSSSVGRHAACVVCSRLFCCCCLSLLVVAAIFAPLFAIPRICRPTSYPRRCCFIFGAACAHHAFGRDASWLAANDAYLNTDLNRVKQPGHATLRGISFLPGVAQWQSQRRPAGGRHIESPIRDPFSFCRSARATDGRTDGAAAVRRARR